MSSELLLIRPGAVGDALLTWPTLQALRRARPAARLTLIAHPAVCPLALSSGLVDRCLSRDSPESDALFAPNPDPARAAFGRLEAAVAWTSDPAGRLHDNLTALGAEPLVLAASQPPDDDPRHVAQYLLDSLAPLGVGGQATWDRPLLGSAAEERAPRPQHEGPLVALHPGSGSRRKNWPPERYEQLGAELARRRDARIVVLLGPAEAEAVGLQQRFAAAAHSVLVERPLLELAALLAACDLYVGNDSGISHLAGLAGARSLVLFGPTEPARWRPLGPEVTVLRRQPLEQLEVEAIVEVALELLDRRRDAS